MTTYIAPATDYLVIDFPNISTSNPAYVGPSTDYLIIDFTPKTGPQSIGQVVMYDGSTFIDNNKVTDLGTVVWYDTTIQSVLVKFTVIAYFQPTFIDVTTLVPSLATTNVLTGDGNLVNTDATVLLSSATIHPAGPIGSFTFTDATSIQLVLGTSILFQPIFSDASSLVFDLVTQPLADVIVPLFVDTTSLVTGLSTQEYFDAIFDDATAETINFSIYPAWVSANPIFDDATSLSFYLATKTDLTGDGALVFNNATALTYDLAIDPAWQPTFVFSDSTDITLGNLSTQIQLVSWFYDSTAMSFTMLGNAQWQPAFTFSDSTALVLPTIAAQQSLPPITFNDGAKFTTTSIINVEFWVFSDSTALLSSMSTTAILTGDGNLVFDDSTSLLAPLTINPSGPIAPSIVFGSGDHLSVELFSLRIANLSVQFLAGEYEQFDFSTSTHHFDLARQSSGPEPDSYYYWKDPDVVWMNLTNSGQQIQPGAVSTGFNSCMVVTVAFKETLEPLPMYSGETMGIVDFWPLLSAFGSMGFGMKVLNIDFVLDSPLCLGNFIPDGAAVSAELSTIDDTSCTVDQARDSTHMSLWLELNMQEAPVFHDQTQMFSSLTVPTGWYFLFLAGELLHVPSYVEFSPVMYAGEFLTVEFKPLSITFTSGEVMTTVPPNTTYTVAFIESGCLQNEYINQAVPVIPFGPPPTANIELRPFFHQIEAECF